MSIVNWLKDQSRQNNLRVDGVKERPNETWEDCEKELDILFKEILGIKEEEVVEGMYRVKADKNKKGSTPRTNVFRILNYKDKVKILGNAKKTER